MKGISSLSNFLRVRPKSSLICNNCQRKTLSSSPSLATATPPVSSQNLPKTPARTRFAPSPTGYLHLGSLRTALFNFLLAKSTGGQFILRIEDTDQKRTIADAEDRICQDLEWAGLEWDEGPKKTGSFGPYKQSERTTLYQKHAEKLLESGHAYRCFCTAERLHTLAKHRTELGLPTVYDRTCTSVSAEESADRAAKGETYVIRFKVPQVYPEFNDLVYKRVRNRQPKPGKAELYPAFEDPILLKSDGFPTYHLANVVDDHEMKITHVVRGAEWMSSTPKHLAMYEAFSWKPPAFAHVGLLMDENHQKLSKRNLDINIAAFRDMGIFPETLTNFVALLGWSHSQNKDGMSLRELIDNFSMKFTTGNTVVTFDKLWYLQKVHADRYAAVSRTNPNLPQMSLMIEPVMAVLDEKSLLGDSNHILDNREPIAYISSLLRADARNFTNATGFVQRNEYFFDRPDDVDLLDTIPELDIPLEELKKVISAFAAISEIQWDSLTIRTTINSIAETNSEEFLLESPNSQPASKIIHNFLRWALLAGRSGPTGGDTIEILGRKEVLSRLDFAFGILKGLVVNGPESAEDLG